MPPIHHRRLAEAVEVGFCRGLPVGFRFLLVRLLFLDIMPPSVGNKRYSHAQG